MSSWTRALRSLNYVMGALFALSAALQLNDPDPVRWIGLYLAAALVCALAARGQWPEMTRALAIGPAAALGAAALVWAATVAPGVIGVVEPDEIFRSMEMGGAIEEGRELGGLLIVAGWMLVQVAVPLWRRRGRPRTAPR